MSEPITDLQIDQHEQESLLATKIPQDRAAGELKRLGHGGQWDTAPGDRHYAIRTQGRTIAVAILREAAGAWRVRTIEGRGQQPPEHVRNAADILARTTESAERPCPFEAQLNPLLPDPSLPYADPSTRRAAEMAQRAAQMPYRSDSPCAARSVWEQAMETARLAARQPDAAATLAEVAFLYQMAVNAGVLAGRYDAASEIMPHCMDAARRAETARRHEARHISA